MLNEKCSSPNCAKRVDDDHRYFDFHSISCNICNTSKHWSCHGLSKTDYLLIREMSDYPFICTECRKRSQVNYGIKELLTEVVNEKIGFINLTENGNSIRIDDVKMKIQLSLSLGSPNTNNASKIRRSRYDPVPNPVAVDREDETEPVYEIPKFSTRDDTNENFYYNEKDVDDDENSKCYYV